MSHWLPTWLALKGFWTHSVAYQWLLVAGNENYFPVASGKSTGGNVLLDVQIQQDFSRTFHSCFNWESPFNLIVTLIVTCFSFCPSTSIPIAFYTGILTVLRAGLGTSGMPDEWQNYSKLIFKQITTHHSIHTCVIGAKCVNPLGGEAGDADLPSGVFRKAWFVMWGLHSHGILVETMNYICWIRIFKHSHLWNGPFSIWFTCVLLCVYKADLISMAVGQTWLKKNSWLQAVAGSQFCWPQEMEPEKPWLSREGVESAGLPAV